MAHTTTPKSGLALVLVLMLLGAWGCASPSPPTATPTRPNPLPTWTPLGPTATPRPLGTRVIPDTPTPSVPSPEPTKARRVAPVVGSRAPDFILWDLEGDEVSLSRLRGHPVVLNFWATWCPPCRQEMPELAAAHEAYKERGVLFVGINFQEDADQVRQYVEWMEIPFPVVLDVTGEVAVAYQVRAIPSTFFLDREGTIVRRYTGPLTRELLDQYLAEVLR